MVIFDPDTVDAGPLRTVADLPAGASRLLTEPVGVRHVLVAGEALVSDGRATDRRHRPAPALRGRHRGGLRPAPGRLTPVPAQANGDPGGGHPQWTGRPASEWTSGGRSPMRS